VYGHSPRASEILCPNNPTPLEYILMDARMAGSNQASAAHKQDEERVLRGLCSDRVTDCDRAEIVSRLKGYVWLEAEHRVVFEAIARCGQMGPAALRAELQSATTRLGFPDLDLAEYLRDEDAVQNAASELNRAASALLNSGEPSQYE
jgi:hypothetical protein